MKNISLYLIKKLILKHLVRSLCLTTNLIILCLCMHTSLKGYGQKNEFGIVYTFAGYNYDEMSDFGFRYMRYVKPRVIASFSFDNQKNAYVMEYETGRNFSSLFGDLYKHNTSITNFDLCLQYNCLKPDNRLSLNPFLGISNQLYIVNYIPLAEFRDNTLTYYKEVRDYRSSFVMPKFGLNVSYRIYSLLKIGVELYYKSLYNATDKRIFTEKINWYNNQGLYANNTRTYNVPNQFGISFSLLVQF